MDNMEITENWYYVIIRNPDTPYSEFVGFSDDTTDEKFVPVFKNKQDAKACFAKLPKDVFKEKYDVHAVIQDDIITTASQEGHDVYVVDETGRILNQLG